MSISHNPDADQEELRLALADCERRYEELLQAVTDYTYTVLLENGVVVETRHSRACQKVTGFSSNEYQVDPHLWFNMIYEEDRGRVLQFNSDILTGQKNTILEHRIYHKNGSIRWVKNIIVRHCGIRNELIAYDGLIRDITAKKKAETDKEKIIVQLKQSLTEIKVLKGILPLCSFCKKVRNDGGYWEQVDVYIKKYTDAEITHSLCPECLKKHYPEEYEDMCPEG